MRCVSTLNTWNLFGNDIPQPVKNTPPWYCIYFSRWGVLCAIWRNTGFSQTNSWSMLLYFVNIQCLASSSEGAMLLTWCDLSIFSSILGTWCDLSIFSRDPLDGRPFALKFDRLGLLYLNLLFLSAVPASGCFVLATTAIGPQTRSIRHFPFDLLCFARPRYPGRADVSGWQAGHLHGKNQSNPSKNGCDSRQVCRLFMCLLWPEVVRSWWGLGVNYLWTGVQGSAKSKDDLIESKTLMHNKNAKKIKCPQWPLYRSAPKKQIHKLQLAVGRWLIQFDTISWSKFCGSVGWSVLVFGPFGRCFGPSRSSEVPVWSKRSPFFSGQQVCGRTT